MVVSLLLTAYFEVLGQYLLYKIDKQFKAPVMGIGLLFMMAFSYLSTSLIAAFHGPFWIVFGIYVTAIMASFFFIIKDFRKIKWFFDYRQWLIILVFTTVMIWYAYDTTLGYLNSFDTVYYLNLITSNIKASQLNMTDLFYGTMGTPVPPAYEMQSYYTFASSITLIIRKTFSLFGTAYNTEIIIWVFQIIYDVFLSSALVLFMSRSSGKRLLKGVLLFIFLFYFGKLYYNNVYGFFGNTYRIVCTAYSVLFIHELIRESLISNRILFAISIWGACAFSSTSVFITCLLLFAAYFVMSDLDMSFFKYLAVVMFFPLADFLYIIIQKSLLISILGSALICVAMYLLNDVLFKISSKKQTRYIILGISFVAMLGLSFYVTGNFLDFSAFFDNMSEIYDMSVNYFHIDPVFNIATVYKIFVLIVTLTALVIKRKDRLYMMFWILIIVFFNPFCCSFINRINVVYYRAYDIIINPYTLVLFYEAVIDRVDNKYFYYAVNVLALVAIVIVTDFMHPMYYHYSFKPTEGYNKLAKMNNDELDIINKINENIYQYGIKDPYIVTNNLLTQSDITEARYLFGRDYRLKEDHSLSEKILFEVFMDKEEDNDNIVSSLQLKDLDRHIKDAGIDFIVVENDAVYYDTEDDNYYYLMHYMYELGNVIYVNDGYSLFMYGH